MRLKSLFVAAVLGLAGLSLSSCVDGGYYEYSSTYYGNPYYGGPYYGGGYYPGGYYRGGGVIIGSGGYYGPGYRYNSYRYGGGYRRYYRSGRSQYSGRNPGYRYAGRPGSDHHRRIPRPGGNN